MKRRVLIGITVGALVVVAAAYPRRPSDPCLPVRALERQYTVPQGDTAVARWVNPKAFQPELMPEQVRREYNEAWAQCRRRLGR